MSAGAALPSDPPRAARSVAAAWRRLARANAPEGRMGTSLLDGLPAPARRWTSTAVPEGTPLWGAVELHSRGEIRIGSWRPYVARQVLTTAGGFIWAATARVAGLPVTGFDRYCDGSGEMRWKLLGLLPVMTGTGDDTTRSAAGRFAGEAVSLLPTAFSSASWTDDSDGDPDVAVATVGAAGDDHEVRLRIDAEGSLRSVSLMRWGNPGGGAFGLHSFEVTVDDEERFEGVRLMSRFRAGWRTHPDQPVEEFFRAEITAARFLGSSKASGGGAETRQVEP